MIKYKHSIKNRLIYLLNNSLDKSPSFTVFWALTLLLLVIFLISLLVNLFGFSNEDSIFIDFINFSFLLLEYEEVSETLNLFFEFSNIIVHILGIIFMGFLIATITTGLASRLDTIRESNLPVIEEGHIIILGWSNQIYSLVSELIIANESEKKCVIAILGELPRSEMYQKIRENIKIKKKNVKIICRQGDCRYKSSVEILSPDTSKVIIINSNSYDESDVFKTLLAITNRPNRKKDNFHIVTSINNSEEIALCKTIGKEELEIIDTNVFLPRLEAQTIRQEGLPIVYEDLFDFEGDEIYLKNEKQLYGKSFSECLTAYDKTVILGIFSNGKAYLNPPHNRIYKKNEKLIGISEDDSTFLLSETEYKENFKKLNSFKKVKKINNGKAKSENYIILGFNKYTENMIKDMEEYVPKKSKCQIYYTSYCKLDKTQFKNLNVIIKKLNHIDRKFLEELNLENINSISIESDYDFNKSNINFKKVEYETIKRMLYLKEIRKIKKLNFRIIAELLETNNHELLKEKNSDDFIISEKLISSAIAQISENKELSTVFNDLFVPEGSEIYLKPIIKYINTNDKINFYELVEIAKNYNEIAIGYKLKAFSEYSSYNYNNKIMNFGIMINPNKIDEIDFSDNDFLIVLAQDNYT